MRDKSKKKKGREKPVSPKKKKKRVDNRIRRVEKDETLFSPTPYSKEQVEKTTCKQTYERK
jgi:hypothetical protein